MERKIDFTKDAYDKRSEGYGVGSPHLRFSLVGLRGAISWTIMTGWYQEHVRKEWKEKKGYVPEAIGAAIVIHSTKPTYEGDELAKCDLLVQGECYGDCSFLAGDELFEKFLNEGQEAVWAVLQEWYDNYFEEDKQ